MNMYIGQSYSLASQKVGYSLCICMLIEVVVNVLCAHCTVMLMLTFIKRLPETLLILKSGHRCTDRFTVSAALELFLVPVYNELLGIHIISQLKTEWECFYMHVKLALLLTSKEMLKWEQEVSAEETRALSFCKCVHDCGKKDEQRISTCLCD